MTKEEAYRLIDLYLDEELPVELMSEFNEVLQGSPELQKELEALRWTKHQMRGALEVPASEGQWRNRVLQRLVEHLEGTPAQRVTFCQRGLPLEKEISL